MRGRRVAELILVELVAWTFGCQDRPVPPRSTAAAGAPSLVQTGAVAEVPVAAASDRSLRAGNLPSDPCRVRELIWEDRVGVAGSSVLPAREWMESLAQDVFGGFKAAGDGFVLEVRMVLTTTSSAPGRGHFGSAGFLVGRGSLSGRILEARQHADWEIPAGRGGNEADPGVVRVQEALRRQMEILRGLCQLSFAEDGDIAGWFDHPWWELRQAAATEAGERGNGGDVQGLNRLTGDERREVVLAAIGALGRVDSSEATIETLMALASRADEAVILAVVTALAMMDTPASRRYLRSLSVGHPLAEIRLRAGELLQSLH